VTSDGSPHSRFERALRSGNPALVRAAAAELPSVRLDDALRVCLVLAAAEPHRYEPAAVRWLGRLLLELRGVTIAEGQLAAAGLAALARGREDLATLVAFQAFCRARGLVRAARALDELTNRHGA
jgi:hypothetical protein